MSPAGGAPASDADRVEPLPAVRTIARGDAGFPERLRDLRDPPRQLHVLGDWPVDAPALAVVGTRQSSAYGRRATRALVEAVARAGITVVSGMARGIDAEAHEAALDAGGYTVAVLGTGVDVPYPALHRALHRRLAHEGAVVSEQPMGRTAFQGCFPRRNRIVAALADVTLVVEAGLDSGAMITAGLALELGRTVAAVPGPITERHHEGANTLLRDGAHVVASPADLLALFGKSVAALAAPSLTGDERLVWDAIAAGGADVDTIAALTQLPVSHCLAAITTMELRGVVECAITGEVRRR